MPYVSVNYRRFILVGGIQSLKRFLVFRYARIDGVRRCPDVKLMTDARCRVKPARFLIKKGVKHTLLDLLRLFGIVSAAFSAKTRKSEGGIVAQKGRH